MQQQGLLGLAEIVDRARIRASPLGATYAPFQQQSATYPATDAAAAARTTAAGSTTPIVRCSLGED